MSYNEIQVKNMIIKNMKKVIEFQELSFQFYTKQIDKHQFLTKSKGMAEERRKIPDELATIELLILIEIFTPTGITTSDAAVMLNLPEEQLDKVAKSLVIS